MLRQTWRSDPRRLAARDRGERGQAFLDLVLAVTVRALRDLAVVLRDVHLGGEPLLATAAVEVVDRHRSTSCDALGPRCAAPGPSRVDGPILTTALFAI